MPPLDATQAAALQTAMLLDTIECCRREVADVGLLVAGHADAEALRVLCPGLPIEPQAGQGLGEALSLGLAASVARAGATALVSSDVPGTPPGEVGRAFALLADGADVVLGPAMDGGYWLVAAREGHAEPFRDIPWSTPATLSVTLERCRDAGLRVALLQSWRDVDTAADLAALASSAALVGAPRTARAIRGLVPADDAGAVPDVNDSSILHTAPWRTHVIDGLRFPDGRETSYSYLATPRAVFVVPITANGDVVLVRQYRHPVRDFTLEVPAGAVDPGELPVEAARRELAEEVGATTERVDHLATFYSSSAHLSLRSDVFLARDVVLGPPHPEDGETVTRVVLPFQEAVERARLGRMPEGQTALALLLAAARIDAAG